MDIKDLLGIGVMFVVLAVALAIGGVVLTNTFENQQTTETATEFQNATVTPGATGANYTVLDGDRQNCAFTIASCVVYNGTASAGTIALGAGNYTLYAYSECSLYAQVDSADRNTSTWYVDCPATGSAFDFLYNSTEYGQESIVEFMSWAPTLAIVIMAVIILTTIGIFLVRRFT